MKRATSRHRRAHKTQVLQVRVMSPRIAWFGFLRLLGKTLKVSLILAALVGVGYGLKEGIMQMFHRNPEFQLRLIDLNPNPVMDELSAAERMGIDLRKRPSLFEINLKECERRLQAVPEVSSARVERHMPSTLFVRIIPRVPQVWIAKQGESADTARLQGAILLDKAGNPYCCPASQLEETKNLPVIYIADDPAAIGPQSPETEHHTVAVCLRLLKAACKADPTALRWIDSVRQANEWSLELVTRQGTVATFSLGDHERQMRQLRAALDHASTKNYEIATINLIPKYNVPITLRGESAPRAIPVIDPATSATERSENSLSNRN
jgi:hypothetical protein